MKKITLLCLTFLAFTFCWQANAQSTINITTTGGNYPGEKWVSITDAIDGGGTQFWGQGNGTQCDGAGLINQNISLAPGTYYVNCYDTYDDSWDGTLISVTSYGNILGDNGGVSPDDGEDTDLTSSCEGTPEELEASFMIVVPVAPCTSAIVDSSTVIPDCNNSQFSVDVVVSTIGDGTVITDGLGGSFAVVAGTVTAGPYATGAMVTLNVQHSDVACDFSLGDFEYDDCPIIVPCGTPVNTTYCYLDNDDTTWTFTSSDGSALKVDFIEGYFEDCCDDIIIYDGADTSAAVLFASDDTYDDDATGITASSTGDTITVRIDSDGSVSCDSGSGSPALNFDVICLACSQASATAVVVEDCDASTFTIDVTVTDAGDATMITDGTTPQAVAALMSFGPYAFGTDITLDVTHSDAACDFTLGVYSFEACPPVNDLLADAITINCGDAVMGTTLFATQDEASAPDVATVEDDTSADNDSPWVWYSFTGSGTSEEITLSTCGVANTDFDTEIFVYTGTSGSLNLIDDGYDECGGSAENYAAETTFLSDGTTTYYIAVGGYDSDDTGNFQLSVSCVTLSTESYSLNESFRYYPNPVKNTLTLKGQRNIQNVAVYNMLGQEVIRIAPNTLDSEVDMSNLQPGTYFVKVMVDNATKTIKVIKQ